MVDTFSVNSSAWSYAVTPHQALYPPAPPVLQPHAEACQMSWAMIFSSEAPNVHFDGSPAVQVGHDVGFFIPHITAPNVFLVTVIALSKCKVQFGKSTVLTGGKPAGFWLIGAAMFQVCSDPISLPIGFDVTALLGTTVKFGFSWGDLVAGWVRVGIDIGASLLVKGVAGKVLQKYSARLATRLIDSKVGGAAEKVVTYFAGRKSAQLGEDAIDALIRKSQAQKAIEQTIYYGFDRFAYKTGSWGGGKVVKEGAKTGFGDLNDLGPWIDKQLGEPPPAERDNGGLLDEVPLLEGED